MLCCGCSSIKYGSFYAGSIGPDIQIEKAVWIKTETNETFILDGAKRDSSTSTHAFANMVTAILCGAAGGAGGAAAGFGIAELWQTWKDSHKGATQ